MKEFVLDSWAVISWLQREPAAPAVEDLWIRAGGGDCALYISAINFGEVFYITARHRDARAAEHVATRLRTRVQLLPVPDDLVLRAARIKIAHALSYADCFAAASALELDAPLVTGDPELRALARALPQLQLHWLGA